MIDSSWRATPKSRSIRGALVFGALLVGVLPAAARADSCPCKIFADSATPASVDNYDGQTLELGMKFRSDVNGSVTALRFYKSPSETGPVAATLWSASGDVLGTTNFDALSGSGWREAPLSSPVAIVAGTTYVVSYNTHYYSFTGNYFASQIVSDPLRALANGEEGGNGVYAYGPPGSFPTDSYNASNYWVDVVFETVIVPDTTPPTVSSVAPAADAILVPLDSPITVTFSEALDPATVSASTLTLENGAGNSVAVTVSYTPGSRRVTLQPAAPFNPESVYTVRILGGTAGVADPGGNELAADYNWSFTSGDSPALPPEQGPGGPLLVLTGTGTSFGGYLAEILRNEGLNYFAVADIGTVSPASLAAYEVIVLGETPLTAAQVSMLSDWVTGGGRLIAMRPAPALYSLLGIAAGGSTLADAYLRLDTNTAPAGGLVSQTIQYHGNADRYTANPGTTVLATLYQDPATATPYAAVSVRTVGTEGGWAAAFAYDLARSVVYTRQGNPAWAGQERDGHDPVRPDDMFFGAAAADPQPDWIQPRQGCDSAGG